MKLIFIQKPAQGCLLQLYHNHPNLKASKMPFTGSMDEQIEVHPDNRILFRAEKKSVLCDNLEEWDGVGGRLQRQEHIYLCLIHDDLLQKLT